MRHRRNDLSTEELNRLLGPGKREQPSSRQHTPGGGFLPVTGALVRLGEAYKTLA